MLVYVLFFFFFQAEDGIRDLTVTGVQTCALPIWDGSGCFRRGPSARGSPRSSSRCRRPPAETRGGGCSARSRSGERRGGEEGRSRGAPDHLKKKKTTGEATAATQRHR